MTELLRRLQSRIESSCERLGLSYPWWIPAYTAVACLALTVAAYVQRGSFDAPGLVTLGFVLSLCPHLVWFPSGWLFPPWVEAVITTVAVALYLTEPVTLDFAPLLFLIMAGEVAATSSIWRALAVAALDVTVLIVAAGYGHLHSTTLYVIGVILGADVGIALRWQMRALAAERHNTAIAGERAVLAERQRLAHEVHDVVGHSLSINLLHVTAARHALQQHGDVDDAIESLTEAERVGRGAMGDLRRTVAVLAAGPSETQPLPGLDDVATLIERSRQAGIDITYELGGGMVDLGTAAGLGLYRIVQESLANIAKHAPTASATVDLAGGTDVVRMAVRNTLPPDRPAESTGGRGLPGMAARAEQIGAQLRAGVDGECWLVEVTVPVGTPEPTPAVPG